MHTYLHIVNIDIICIRRHPEIPIYIYIYICLILRGRVGDKIELIEIHKKSCSIYCQYALAQELNRRNETLYTIHYVCVHASASAKVCEG